MTDRRLLWLALGLALTLQGCAALGASAWELRQDERSLPVRGAASLGDTVGFVALAPVSVALFPILVPLVLIYDLGDPYALLFAPSIAAGNLLSVGFGGAVNLALSPFQ